MRDSAPPAFPLATAVLRAALEEGAFPGACAEVGRSAAPMWQATVGRLSAEVAAAPVSAVTAYDLASLTKVLATTTIVMRLAERGTLDLSDPLARWLPGWRLVDREGVTLADLLAHRSGLPAWLPLHESCRGRAEFERAIQSLPLEYAPGTRSVYSDLGFILLGFVLEELSRRNLAELFEDEVAARLGGYRGDIGYAPARWPPDRIAPTEIEPWRGRLLAGEVHDANAWALGGVAGHAGLFGTAGAVGEVARLLLAARRGDSSGLPWLANPETLVRFTTPAGPPGSSRGLGWDTMRPTSSCGRLMSPAAFGHTGFTGTSVWIDPESDVYAVLLTNRVHPVRANDRIARVRPAFHDAVMTDLAVRA